MTRKTGELEAEARAEQAGTVEALRAALTGSHRNHVQTWAVEPGLTAWETHVKRDSCATCALLASPVAPEEEK